MRHKKHENEPQGLRTSFKVTSALPFANKNQSRDQPVTENTTDHF